MTNKNNGEDRLSLNIKFGELDLEIAYYYKPVFKTELNAEDSFPPEVDIIDIVTACVDYNGNEVKVSVYKVMRETDEKIIQKITNIVLENHC